MLFVCVDMRRDYTYFCIKLQKQIAREKPERGTRPKAGNVNHYSFKIMKVDHSHGRMEQFVGRFNAWQMKEFTDD